MAIILIIVGVSCFLGGMIVTGGIAGTYHYVREQRDIRRRTDAIYQYFQESYNDDPEDKIDRLQIIKEFDGKKF